MFEGTKYELPDDATFQQKSEMLRKMRADGEAPLTYTARINEYQRSLMRHLILVAISLPDMKEALAKQPGQKFASALAEAEALSTMLGQIVNDEKEMPGCLHGLCL